jgi:hypothetical protein
MRGYGRPKYGVASLAYDPRIHAIAPHTLDYVRLPPLHCFMDGRVKPGHDVERLGQDNWKRRYRALLARPTSALAPIASTNSTANAAYMRGMSKVL